MLTGRNAWGVAVVFCALVCGVCRGGTVALNGTAPTGNIIEFFEETSPTHGLRTNRGNSQTRANSGQSFQHATPFSISAVTFQIWPNQSGGDLTFTGGTDVVELLIHEDTTANGTPDTVVHSETFDVQGLTFAQGDYLTFNLSTPTGMLDPNTQYGAIMTWTTAESDHFYQIERNNGGNAYTNGGRLFGTNANLTPAPDGGQDATFYIQGLDMTELVRYDSAGGNDLLDPTVVDTTHITNALEMAVGAGGTVDGKATNQVGISGDATAIYVPGSDGTIQTLAEAVTANQNFDLSFDVQGLAAGEQLDLGAVSFQARPNTNNSSSPARYGPMTYQVQASVNGGSFVNLDSDINWDHTNGDDDGVLDGGEFGNAKAFSMDLSALGPLNNADNVVLRLVYRNGDNTGGGSNWNGSTRYGNISVSGEVVPASAVIPEPATLCALGWAVAGLGGYLRRRSKGTSLSRRRHA